MNSKLWMHCNSNFQGLLAYLVRVRPGGVLLLNPNPDWIFEVKTALPQIQIIGRDVFDQQVLDDPARRGVELYHNRIRTKALATRGSVRAWQLYNEESTSNPEQLARLATFSVAAMKEADKDGIRLGIMGASTGTPPRPDEDGGASWNAFKPAVDYAAAHGHILLAHEYGIRAVLDSPRDHVGRLREAVRSSFPSLKQVQIVIAEHGIDGGSYPTHLPRERAGWNHANLSPDTYMSQLAQADMLYQDVPNVLGLCIFCVNSWGGWGSFDIWPRLVEPLAAYLAANPARQGASMIVDSEGIDISQLLHEKAAHRGVSPRLLLACIKAESGLNRTAARYGVWPDVSFGYGQPTVQALKAFGIGDGTNTPTNIANTKAWAFDRTNNLDFSAWFLGVCQGRVKSAGVAHAQEADVHTLVCYNAGSPQAEGNWYWQRYASHAAAYQSALSWADALLGQSNNTGGNAMYDTLEQAVGPDVQLRILPDAFLFRYIREMGPWVIPTSNEGRIAQGGTTYAFQKFFDESQQRFGFVLVPEGFWEKQYAQVVYQ